jgi:putative DNA primase/helicase
VLDTVISLTRPPGYVASEGARFEVRFTKSRGFWGDAAASFEARFANGEWTASEIVAGDSDEALVGMRAEGLTLREIAERTGLSKSAVDRRLKGDDQ